MQKPTLNSQQKKQIRIITLIQRIEQKRVELARTNFDKTYPDCPSDMVSFYILENHWNLLTNNFKFRTLSERSYELYSRLPKAIQQRLYSSKQTQP